MWGISWAVQRLLASSDGLCPLGLVQLNLICQQEQKFEDQHHKYALASAFKDSSRFGNALSSGPATVSFWLSALTLGTCSIESHVPTRTKIWRSTPQICFSFSFQWLVQIRNALWSTKSLDSSSVRGWRRPTSKPLLRYAHTYTSWTGFKKSDHMFERSKTAWPV
jgi:hypothetical protein